MRILSVLFGLGVLLVCGTYPAFAQPPPVQIEKIGYSDHIDRTGKVTRGDRYVVTVGLGRPALATLQAVKKLSLPQFAAIQVFGQFTAMGHNWVATTNGWHVISVKQFDANQLHAFMSNPGIYLLNEQAPVQLPVALRCLSINDTHLIESFIVFNDDPVDPNIRIRVGDDSDGLGNLTNVATIANALQGGCTGA